MLKHFLTISIANYNAALILFLSLDPTAETATVVFWSFYLSLFPVFAFISSLIANSELRLRKAVSIVQANSKH